MIVSERRGPVLVATLSRPPVNAIDEQLLARLEAVLEEADADDGSSVRLRAAHAVFCAGADLAFMRECIGGPAGAETMVAVVCEMQRLFARLEAAPFVTLAEIGGAPLGGGLELACDLPVASAEARLALPEIGLGLLPAGGGTQRLTALVGPCVARRLILGGQDIDGVEAQRLGVSSSGPVRHRPRHVFGATRRAPPSRPTSVASRSPTTGLPRLRRGDRSHARALYPDPLTLERVPNFLNRPKPGR